MDVSKCRVLHTQQKDSIFDSRNDVDTTEEFCVIVVYIVIFMSVVFIRVLSLLDNRCCIGFIHWLSCRSAMSQMINPYLKEKLVITYVASKTISSPSISGLPFALFSSAVFRPCCLSHPLSVSSRRLEAAATRNCPEHLRLQ